MTWNFQQAGAMLLLLLLLVGGCGEKDAEHAGHDHAPATSIAHSHDNSDETCFMCDAAKRDKGRLWCKEHMRYEDRCWLCHAELEDKDRLYCKEHYLYEDECFLCHPELIQDDDATEREGEPQASAELFCNEHGVDEIECGICQPQLATTLQPGDSLKIRFPSATSADKAGVTTHAPVASHAAPGVQAFCETQYNMNTMARVTPLAAGVIRDVHFDVGDVVSRGDVLVALHSADAANAKSAYLAAMVDLDIKQQTHDRERSLVEQNIGAQKDFLEAQAVRRKAELAVNQLRQQLVNLGFADEQIAQIEAAQDTSARLEVRAPFDGTLIERSAVIGEAAGVGDALFTVADLSTRWLILSIASDHIAQVRVGQIVEASFAELPDRAVIGRITWVDTSVDPRSRLVRARAVVTDNVDAIKTGLFGEVRIAIGAARAALLVPRDAVQFHEQGEYVFVRREADLFAMHRVALGDVNGDRVEVLAGLEPGDAVVSGGSFIVMSEFLKSRLGAGCADH
jgi:cobalt-zinc-cadmium efflux system membrane fusion protein